jgi:preprotein translocase subunit SecD
MLQIDLWKRIAIILTIVAGLLLAVPNAFYPRVEAHNDAVLALESGATGAGLEENAAQWPAFLPSGLVNLGLDLRGGAHLLAELPLEDVYEKRLVGFWPSVLDAMRAERATIGTFRRIGIEDGEAAHPLVGRQQNGPCH